MPTEMETRVQHAIFEKHMELLRSFAVDKDLLGPWENQSDLAQDVYLQLARAAINCLRSPTDEISKTFNQWRDSEVAVWSWLEAIEAASPPEETS